MTDRYTTDLLMVQRDGKQMAIVTSADAMNDAQLIAAALNCYTPEAVNKMRGQLAALRNRIVSTLDLVAEFDGARQDMLESRQLVDNLLLTLPRTIPPAGGIEAVAIAEAREAMRQPMVAVLVQDGMVEQVVATKPLKCIILDHDTENADRCDLIGWDDAGRTRYATCSVVDVDVAPGVAINFFAEASDLFERQVEAAETGDQPVIRNNHLGDDI